MWHSPRLIFTNALIFKLCIKVLICSLLEKKLSKLVKRAIHEYKNLMNRSILKDSN